MLQKVLTPFSAFPPAERALQRDEAGAPAEAEVDDHPLELDQVSISFVRFAQNLRIKREHGYMQINT
jgi:hypothetical protein